MRLSYLLIVTAAVAALFISPATAAGTPFSVSGQVLDRYGNPVQGADVMLIDNSYKTISVKCTNENGNYDFINVLSDTDTVSVRVNLTRDGKTYDLPSYYVRWYPARGIQYINGSETKFPDYPELVYGYIYGVIQTGEGSVANYITGIVYLVSLDSGIKYYEFADRADGKASYTFYAPAGNYILYAQHRENGLVYESARKAVTISPNAAITDVLETRIILPLNAPSNSPDPADAPSRQANTVSGTLITTGNRPLPGATVTLYERSDNASAFIPVLVNGRAVTAATDDQGRYKFDGVVPTTDDGKPIQGKKGIKAIAEYFVTENLTINAETEEKPLYYPDMLMANGQESAARNVVFAPVTMNVGGSIEVSSPTPAPVGSVSIQWVPLLAAVAIGILCLAGLYLFLNRKGS